MEKFGLKRMLRIIALSWTYMTAFLLPYIQYTFYTPLQEGLGVSHEQLGNLLSLYSLACLVAYIPGGWIADRFSLRNILIISMAANILLALFMTFSFNYISALIVWPLTALTSGFAFWAALVKGVGLSGSSKEQGKIWGSYEFFDAGFGLCVSYLNLFIFAQLESSFGIKGVFASIAVMSLISVILFYLFFHDTQVDTQPKPQSQEKTKLGDLVNVLKLPVIWLVTLVVFTNYIVFAGMTYFTPYLSDVLGYGIVASGSLAIIRSWAIRMLAGPVFGKIVDSSKSVSKTIFWGMIATAVFILIFIFSPTNSPIILIAFFFMATFTLSGSRGVMFANLEESKIPNGLRGLSIAIVSMIGYTPDLFVYKVFGGILDDYGNNGYRIIFSILVITSLIAATSSFALYIKNKKMLKNHT